MVKKQAKQSRKRLSTLMVALTSLPNALALPSEKALAAITSKCYNSELGCVAVEDLHPDKLLAFRSQLQDFSNEIALLEVVNQVEAFPVVVDSVLATSAQMQRLDLLNALANCL